VKSLVDPGSQEESAAIRPIDSEVATPYFPADPEVPIQLALEMVPVPRPAGAEPLSAAQAEQWVESYRASLPTEVAVEERERWVGLYRDRVTALFEKARTSPDELFGGGRVFWQREGDRLVLRHRAPGGAVTDLGIANPAEITPVQMWWIELALTVICGLAGLFGIGPGDLAKRALKYLVKNRRWRGSSRTSSTSARRESPRAPCSTPSRASTTPGSSSVPEDRDGRGELVGPRPCLREAGHAPLSGRAGHRGRAVRGRARGAGDPAHPLLMEYPG
jgi:hypothetical protein